MITLQAQLDGDLRRVAPLLTEYNNTSLGIPNSGSYMARSEASQNETIGSMAILTNTFLNNRSKIV